MNGACRDFGISRKIGYKLFTCYKNHGVEALCDRSHVLRGTDRQALNVSDDICAALGRNPEMSRSTPCTTKTNTFAGMCRGKLLRTGAKP
jgi:hypothetical protein